MKSKPCSRFSVFARWTAHAAGTPSAFLAAMVLIVVWGATGPLFGYSDTWQLVINTGTTIVTFLMVFLIQNTQNRDSASMQVQLSELIRAIKGAKDSLANLDELDEVQLESLHQHYVTLAEQARHHVNKRRKSKSKAKS